MLLKENNTISFTLNEPNLLDQIQQHVFNRQCYIGRYKIIAELGGGAFAKVFQCWSSQDQQRYALKIYSYDIIDSKFDEHLRRIMKKYIDQQAKLMQKCKSPHVVKCFQTIQSKRYKILVLEYCSNENLWQYLGNRGKTKCLKESEAVNIIAQISLGLIELHKNNIIHRDLKLQNIMVKKGICKIIDLGLSRQLKSQSCILSTNVGTEYTKAPEVRHNKPYGLKADIFSLGVIYLNLISDSPFEKRSAHNFYNNREILFSNSIKISQNSIDFINRTIEVNPSLRISWRNLLHHNLFKNIQPLSESQIFQIEANLKLQLNQATVILLDCKSSVIPPQSGKYKSSIFLEEEESEESQLPKLSPISEQTEFYASRDYSEQARQYFLNCKKAEFILSELIENIQNCSNRRMERESESCNVLLYLLSLQAHSLIVQAQKYYKANYYEEFLAQVNIILQKASSKFIFYQQILIDLLKCVKNAFVQNEILKNYEPLKDFLKFQKVRIIDIKEEHLNLIVYYIKKLIKAAIFNRKVRTRLYSFRKVMMITLEDLKTSTFETKVNEIRLSYHKL